MKQISKEEAEKIKMLLEGNPELFLYFKEKINDNPIAYNEGYAEEFDQDFYKDYMEEKLEKVLVENSDKFKMIINDNKITEKHVMQAFEESGSFGLSLLIEDMIKKLEKESEISQELLDSLASIIHTRNELLELELSFINEEYLEYLNHRYQSLTE